MKSEKIKTIACVNEYINSGRRLRMEELELAQDMADILIDGICKTCVVRKGCVLDIGAGQKKKVEAVFFDLYAKGSLPSNGYRLRERQPAREGLTTEIVDTFCISVIYFVFIVERTYLELIRIYFSDRYNKEQKAQQFINALKNARLQEGAAEQFKETYLSSVKRKNNIYALAEFLEYWKRVWNYYAGGTFR